MEGENIKNLYELTFWISPDFKDDEARNYFEKIKIYIQDLNGEIKKEINLVKNKLAYKINKKNYGYLGTLYFYLDPNNIKELEKKLKSEINILRFLIIKTTKHHLKLLEEAKAPILKTKTKSAEKIKTSEGTKTKMKLEELDKKLEEILGRKL